MKAVQCGVLSFHAFLALPLRGRELRNEMRPELVKTKKAQTKESHNLDMEHCFITTHTTTAWQ